MRALLLTVLASGCIPTDARFDGQEYTPDTGWELTEPTGCVPDEALAVSRDELDFSADIETHYRSSGSPPNPDDWGYAGVGTTSMTSGNEALDGHWFAGRFSGATHTAPLDRLGTNWGIYREDASGLALLGVASGAPDVTALTYSPAVQLWTWPLAAGSSVQTDAVATGLYDGDSYPMDVGFGNEITLTHSYDVSVDGAGQVEVDAGIFDAQRVHIALTAVGTDNFTIEYGRVQTDSWLFVAPCAGLVARITDTGFMGLGL